MTRPTVDALTERLRLEPLPLEGGLFRQTWVGEERDGRPVGTAIVVLLAAEGGHFSALHRLPIDEVWYFQAGDPIELLLLEPGTPGRVAMLGPDVLGGHELQVVVSGPNLDGRPGCTGRGVEPVRHVDGARLRPRGLRPGRSRGPDRCLAAACRARSARSPDRADAPARRRVASPRGLRQGAAD